MGDQNAGGYKNYLVTRIVEEWISVGASDEEEALLVAAESPIDNWSREVKEEQISEDD